MTGILEKPTTNSSGGNVHCLFSVRNMFFSNFGYSPGFKFWVPPGLMSVAGFEMEDGRI
jgi:hypothetical protein